MSATNVREVVNQVVKKSRIVAGDAMATADVCGPVLRFAIEELGCLVADVWSVDPRQRKLILIANEYKERKPEKRLDVLAVDRCLTGDVVETKRTTYFDLQDTREDGREFSDQGLRDTLGVDKMLSIPVLNTTNPHQVLCVLNFLPESGDPLGKGSRRRLATIANVLATSIEGSLRERAYRMSMMLAQQLAEHKEINDRLTIDIASEILAACCMEAMTASRVAIYLKDPVENRLKLKRIESVSGPEAVTRDGDGGEPEIPVCVSEVMRTNRELLVPQLAEEDAPEPEELFEFPAADADDATCVLVPLQDLRGKCEGVIHCSRRTHGDVGTRFSYDDIAILEAMSQAFVPPLETLLQAERRRFSQQKLSHELRVPVTAFGAMLSKMQEESQQQDFTFHYPHFDEGKIYIELMKRLLMEVDIDRFGASGIPLRPQSTNVQNSVIIPALRFTIPLLRERRMYAWQFEYSGFDSFPKLKIDPALITQVVFNLLDNAIKYFDGAPLDFRCKLEGIVTKRHYEISVADNGPGLNEDNPETLFKYGCRGANRRANAFGEGLGLWISKSVAKRHGGDLIVRKRRDWTTIVFQLPRRSSEVPWPIKGL